MAELPLDSWDSSCHPRAAAGLGRGAAAAGRPGSSPELLLHTSSLPKLGESPAKSPFLPMVRVLCPLLAQECLGFPCRGSGCCSLTSGVAFVRVGLERGSQNLWNLQNRFQHLKIQALPGLPAQGPSHSPSQGFLPLQALWGERGISGAALSPV